MTYKDCAVCGFSYDPDKISKHKGSWTCIYCKDETGVKAPGTPSTFKTYEHEVKIPGTCASGGTGDTAWTDYDNVKVEDRNYAMANSLSQNQTTEELQATNFGFAIPSTGTIVGIVLQFSRDYFGKGLGMRDYIVKLIISGTAAGDSKADTTYNWSNQKGTMATFGDKDELWGNTLTPTIVNASNFGVAIQAKNHGSDTKTPRIYFVKLIVFYTDST